MGNDAHSRHDRDVDLGMSEEPEQMLPQKSRPARMRLQLVVDDEIGRDEEASAGDVIENQQDARGHQDRKCCKTHAGGNEPGPGTEWQAHQAHAFDTEIERGGDEVQCTQQLANTEKRDRRCPQNHAQALAWTRNRTHGTERSILGPATQGRSITHEERRDQNQEGHERDPEGHHVEVGKGHVLGAYLNGQEVIAEGREWRRGEHEKDHDRAMHGHQLQVVLGRHHAAGCAILRKGLQAGNRGGGPAQVDAHHPGKHHSHQSAATRARA